MQHHAQLRIQCLSEAWFSPLKSNQREVSQNQTDIAGVAEMGVGSKRQEGQLTDTPECLRNTQEHRGINPSQRKGSRLILSYKVDPPLTSTVGFNSVGVTSTKGLACE